jgi:hypothetical protein
LTDNNIINTYNESPLHAALKSYIAQPGDEFETSVDGYIIDVKRGDLLIEVQTRLFSAIKGKLNKLSEKHHVHLVHPITLQKWIVKSAIPGDPISKPSRRKSPYRGSPLHIFAELVSIPKLIHNPNFTLEVLYTHEEDVRHWVGKKRAWRRKGWAIKYRKLIEVVGHELYSSASDFTTLLPGELPESFTTHDLATFCHCNKRLAGQMAYCLREMGVLDHIGKRRNAYLYQISDN